MTPKEKAKELVDKFSVVGLQQRDEGISCALICVDEIINIVPYASNKGAKWILDEETQSYWEQVKQEIEKI